ncbi:MAG TPA: hypothetical protein VLH13_05700, partial [Methanomassiliicoccales archaeon]|nr:hypothetical protein [Methanomassiliicoccales archaeon]
LVGDAAGQVKPLSGGGLFTGLSAAKMAAEVAGRALKGRDMSASFLKSYETMWRRSIGRDISRAYWVRKAFVRMKDGDLDEAGRLMDRQEVREVLSKGDIDHPTEIAGELLRRAPGLLRFSPQLLASLILDG